MPEPGEPHNEGVHAEKGEKTAEDRRKEREAEEQKRISLKHPQNSYHP
ncbi:MAG: hypothetical protein ACRYFZ_26935 [Janthinobacterium lividum]